MEEKLTPETVWYLKKMLEIGEKAISEGKTYTHEEVKALIKSRYHHESNLAATCVG
ncbi:MAG: hypothetical protein MJZ32_02470 [Bacteroidaceae bacterium]|nr:hypothetical protein [Bacteroidaceae bacterium]